MRTKIVIGALTVAAILAWTGMAGAQTAASAPKVQLPSGQAVWDLRGEWNALIENYGPWKRFGTYPNVYGIEQDGCAFTAFRLKASPPPGVGVAESPSLQGELERNGFKHVEIVTGTGGLSPSTGHISEDGKKMVIDNGRSARVSLTRP